ncbi:MAG: hypothetical protein A2234_09695 [Elusimicrobia bacterium RIFOXYA2_FULL_58_8]|nr:MAG: hypothetical protein A2285_06985 [Elusimicrobia bacterium RIFOXYA12_FULL_57_11]OGS14064.1 MAG: hypothetical protein A2234_09695 [Elusimicrobia bacterium RIFOXYA2_FULL_58_8]
MKKKQSSQQPEKNGFLTRRKFYAAAFIVFFIIFARSSFILTVRESNGRFVVTSHQALEEDFSHPKLLALRTREKLDAITAQGKTQFEKMVMLRQWARRQWEPGSKFYYPPWDAAEILDLARKHKNYGFCAQYGVVFAQACMAMGIHARYIDIVGHFVSEAWSDEYAKWVAMDPYNDVHYERDAVPLNARELCRAYWENDLKGLTKVDSAGNKTRIKKTDIELYRMYALYLRSNHLAHPVTVERSGGKASLSHEPDFRRYPAIGAGPSSVVYIHTIVSFRDKFARENFTAWPVLEDLETYHRPVNQTIMSVAGSETQGDMVKVALTADQAPAFDTFLMKFNGGGWQRAPAKMMGQLEPGFNKLAARLVTKEGWQGPESSVELFYKPPWGFKW